MEKTPFFTVIEVQNEGTPAVIPVCYTSESAAYHGYFTACAAASISQIPYHAAFLITDDGIIKEHKIFDRRTTGGGQ